MTARRPLGAHVGAGATAFSPAASVLLSVWVGRYRVALETKNGGGAQMRELCNCKRS